MDSASSSFAQNIPRKGRFQTWQISVVGTYQYQRVGGMKIGMASVNGAGKMTSMDTPD